MLDGLVDTHCHLYDTRGVPVADVIAAARAAGVGTMVNVGCDEATTRAAIAIAQTDDRIWATAGLHPHEAKFGVDTIVPFLDHPKVIAVGEAGLDYYYDHSPRDAQRAAFAVIRCDREPDRGRRLRTYSSRHFRGHRATSSRARN